MKALSFVILFVSAAVMAAEKPASVPGPAKASSANETQQMLEMKQDPAGLKAKPKEVVDVGMTCVDRDGNYKVTSDPQGAPCTPTQLKREMRQQ